MELIGQKAILPNTDEVIVAGELEVSSVETGEERMFDTALEEIIAEHPHDESSLGEMIGEDDLNTSLASVIFTQNQIDPEVFKENFGEIDYAAIPSEIVNDNLWNKDSLSVQSQVLKKSTTVAQEMIEVLDPRIVTEENNFESIPAKGVAETGIQSLLLQGSNHENQETLLHTVFHRVKPQEVNSDFSEDDLQSVLQKNTRLPVEQEGDAEFSVEGLQTIIQKNTSQTAKVQEISSVVQDLKPVQENQVGSSQKEPQILYPQGLQENSHNSEKTIEENLVKIEPAEKFKATKSPQVADLNTTTEQLEDKVKVNITAVSQGAKESKVTKANEDRIKIETADVSQAKGEFRPGKEIDGEVVLKTAHVSNEVDKFKATGEIDRRVKVNSGLQMAGIENSRDFSEKANIRSVDNLKATESQQIVDKIKITEALLSEETDKIKGGLRINTGVSQATEKFNVSEGGDGGLKAKLDSQINGVENWRDISEKATILSASKQLKAAKSQQIVDRIKMTEGMESKIEEEIGIGLKAKSGLQMTGVENSKNISEKVFTQPLNQFRTLASEETQLSTNAKSTLDLTPPQEINTFSEFSGTSIFKAGETSSTQTETVRGTNIPFDMEQVVNRVRILRGNGVEEMTLRLHPEELGQITLKVRQSGRDLLIEMRVDNPLAKQMVESGFDSLRSRFLDQEFSYQDLALNVDINERESQYGSDREFEENFSSEKGIKEEISSLEETPQMRHRTDSGLNLYV